MVSHYRNTRNTAEETRCGDQTKQRLPGYLEDAEQDERHAACIPKVKLLHLLFDTSKRDVKDLTAYLHHNTSHAIICIYICFFSVSQVLKAQMQPL